MAEPPRSEGASSERGNAAVVGGGKSPRVKRARKRDHIDGDAWVRAAPFTRHAVRRVERSFLEQDPVTGYFDVKRFNTPSMYVAHGHREATCIPINVLPLIMDRIVEDIPEKERSQYDLYKVQVFLLEQCVDAGKSLHGDDNEARVNDFYRRCAREVLGNTRFHSRTHHSTSTAAAAAMHQRVTNESAEESGARGPGEAYAKLMDSAEMESMRYYREHEWTPDEHERFLEAFRLFGNGVNANKRIAQHVGPTIHPNHVVRYKITNRALLNAITKEEAAKAAAAEAAKEADVEEEE